MGEYKAKVCESAKVYGSAKVCGSAKVYGSAKVDTPKVVIKKCSKLETYNENKAQERFDSKCTNVIILLLLIAGVVLCLSCA